MLFFLCHPPVSMCLISTFSMFAPVVLSADRESVSDCGATVPNASSPEACHPLQLGFGGVKDSLKVKPAQSGETEGRK